MFNKTPILLFGVWMPTVHCEYCEHQPDIDPSLKELWFNKENRMYSQIIKIQSKNYITRIIFQGRLLRKKTCHSIEAFFLQWIFYWATTLIF